jgi:hypothetical protein
MVPVELPALNRAEVLSVKFKDPIPDKKLGWVFELLPNGLVHETMNEVKNTESISKLLQ